MFPNALVLPLLLAVAAGLAMGTAEAQDGARHDLEVVAGRTIFFGHQSVGTNLLEGLRELAAQEGLPLRIQEGRGAELRAVTHATLAENGDPDRKLRSFEEAVGAGAVPDVALMKFCYVDVGERTDAGALFARYQAMIHGLRARLPRTTFVHVTVPLTAVQGGVKGLAKRALGRPPAGLLDDARREEFNALLRQAYQGREPVFDLARVESTAPDGTRRFVHWGGRDVPVLATEYTDDGGHLNAQGRLRAARALAAALAAAPLVVGADAAQ